MLVTVCLWPSREGLQGGSGDYKSDVNGIIDTRSMMECIQPYTFVPFFFLIHVAIRKYMVYLL